MHPMLNIAFRAARKASVFIAKYYGILNGQVSQKSNNDFLVNIDREAERLIVEVIHKFYPQHVIIGEECGKLAGEDNDVQWIINPLDGIRNFANHLPHFAVSVAVRIKSRTEIAVVYDPMRNELFTATRGQGAQLNGCRLRGGVARDLNGTILATGFPFKQKQHVGSYLTLISKLFIQCADLRRIGSTALDFAYVAAGRVDGFFEIGLRPWSIICGELLVHEAGGLVTDFTGGHNYLLSGNVVAGNPRVVKAILLAMRNASE
ncbi:MAG: inositol-phosphate phosphatase [Sodalis sp. Psp]|nr:inositol-phosphate phosphatase [Sodalis sp. Psp]MCR3757298.1 inositol-phosphate phosphatase [Sodalis sp. Ppy]